MKITIIGTGYVGLTEGVCFADKGFDVVCVDIDEDKVEKLQKGIPTIYEDGLEVMLKRNVDAGRINFTTDLAKAVDSADVIIIAVNTPESEVDGSADLTAVFAVSKAIAKSLNKYAVVVTRSTVPVGTSKKVAKVIQEENPSLDFDIAFNPEFSAQGRSIEDFMKPDRIVVGTESKKAEEVIRKIYEPITKQGYPILFTNIETAELIKYASNAFLAVKIGFVNEMADLCEKTGGNIAELAKAMGLDSRISPKFLNAGPGFGGSCFPKDTMALTRTAKEFGVRASIVEAAVESNKQRKISMAKKVIDAFDGSVAVKTIAVLGLAFKANTDDTRYSPAIVIVKELVKAGAKVKVYDPQAFPKAKVDLADIDSSIEWHTDQYSAIKNSDATVIATEWAEFKELNLQKIKGLQKSNIIVDLRNVLNEEEVKKMGFRYISIGK